MAESPQLASEGGAPLATDLYLLAVRSRELAKQAASVLTKNPVDWASTEARLAAARAFDVIAHQPGGEDAMRLQEPAARLQLIVDFISQWDATGVLDLSRSESWTAIARLNAADLAAARLVCLSWARAGRAELLKQMQADQLRHYNEETWRR